MRGLSFVMAFGFTNIWFWRDGDGAGPSRGPMAIAVLVLIGRGWRPIFFHQISGLFADAIPFCDVPQFSIPIGNHHAAKRIGMGGNTTAVDQRND